MHPSFSMMHSLSEGYSIKVFSSTHNTKAEEGQLHKKNAVRLVLPPDTILLWHERVYHAGAKSRLTKCHVDGRYGFHLCQEDADKSPSRCRNIKRKYQHQEDLRFFSYVYNEAGKMFRRSADGSVSAGDRLYKRPQLFCKGIDDPDYVCPNCDDGEFVVDLSDLSRSAYVNGQKKSVISINMDGLFIVVGLLMVRQRRKFATSVVRVVGLV